MVIPGSLGLLVAHSAPLSRVLPLIVVTALLITLLLRLAWRTAIRLLTAEQWRRRAWIIFGTGLGWCLLAPVSRVSPIVSILMMVTKLVILVTITRSLIKFHRAFRLQWLPSALPAKGHGEIAPVGPRLVSFSLIFLVAALTTGYVFLAPLPVSP